MNFKVLLTDITEELAARKQPVRLIDRPRVGAGGDNTSVFGSSNVSYTGDFWVPNNSLQEEVLGWSPSRKGPKVRVPMYGYVAATENDAWPLAAAMELGFKAGFDFSRRYQRMPIEVILLMSPHCDKVDDQFWFYLGLAIQI